jgi:hypothetical protein
MLSLIYTIYSSLLHTLGFSVFTSRLLATDLNTETSASNHYEVFLSSVTFYSSVLIWTNLHNSLRTCSILVLHSQMLNPPGFLSGTALCPWLTASQQWRTTNDLHCRVFFCFWGGWPLHNAQSLIFHSKGGRHFLKVQFLIFRNPTVDLTIHFSISSPVVFLRVSLTFAMLSHCSFFRSHFFRYQSHPLPRSFTPFLPSWHIRTLSLTVHTLRIPHSSLALIHLLLTMFLLPRATLVQWNTFLGSVSLALHVTLQLDAGPRAASSMFPKISPRPHP